MMSLHRTSLLGLPFYPELSFLDCREWFVRDHLFDLLELRFEFRERGFRLLGMLIDFGIHQDGEALDLALVVLLGWIKRECILATQCNKNEGGYRSHGLALGMRINYWWASQSLDLRYFSSLLSLHTMSQVPFRTWSLPCAALSPPSSLFLDS